MPQATWTCGGCRNCSADSSAKGGADRCPIPPPARPRRSRVACAAQAWASGTPFSLLEAPLGLEFDAARGEIRLRDPHLPEFLNEVLLRDLRLGPSSVDLRVRRH